MSSEDGPAFRVVSGTFSASCLADVNSGQSVVANNNMVQVGIDAGAATASAHNTGQKKS